MTQPEDDAARLHPHGAKPMSSEPVSDMRLDKELAVVKGGIDINAERDEEPFVAFSGERVTDLYAMLSELKSRRAQQAEPPAGCAEMATTIEKAIADAEESGFDEWRCGIIHDKLAPLFTLLKRVPEVFSDRECVLHEGYCPGCTLLADIDAVLDGAPGVDAALGKGDADGAEEGK
jgi:hypothetical protein